MSEYRNQRLLRWVVEVHTTGGGGGQWWEAIAAFNVDCVATDYANACSRNGLGQTYRVVERRGNKWTVLHTVKEGRAA